MDESQNTTNTYDPKNYLPNIYDLLTPALKSWAEKIPLEIFEMSQKDIEEAADPSVLQRRLKIKFWTHYEQAVSRGFKEINVSQIVSDFCSRQYFYKEIVEKPMMFAWLLTSPINYDLLAQEALSYGIDRIRKEILTAPMFDANGKYNPNIGNMIFQAVKLLDSRVKGSPLQRIEQKNLSHTVHEKVDNMTVAELDREIREIQARLAGGTSLQIKAPDETE